MFGKVDQKVHDVVVQERDAALETIETLTGEKETLTGQVTTLTNERNQAKTELQTAQNDLTTANGTISSLQAQVSDLTAKLAKRPGASATEINPKTETIVTEEEFAVVADPVMAYAKEIE